MISLFFPGVRAVSFWSCGNVSVRGRRGRILVGEEFFSCLTRQETTRGPMSGISKLGPWCVVVGIPEEFVGTEKQSWQRRCGRCSPGLHVGRVTASDFL